MLTVPAIATIDGASVWADDTSFFTFYITSAAPRLRLDENDDPIFLMVQYALSDSDREDDPSLPVGGGYTNFDSTFAPTPDEETAARVLLQPLVDAQWNRLRNGTPQERNLQGVGGTSRPPKVVFASPTWTSGEVTMFAPQSTALVSAQIATGAPDLMAGNIATFSMETTPAGADFMRQTLLADGAGSNLTPIQLRYSLGFWARLPPISITVTAQAEQVYEETRQFMEGSGVDGCSTYDFQNTDITTSLAEMSGLIEVHIDPGSASVDDAVLEELRQYALDMMQQLIESSFFTDDVNQAAIPGAPDDFIPEINTDPNAPTKKWLKKSFDISTMDLELNLTQEAVVEWVINPQATLQTFFEGRSEAEMAQFVRQIRLDDPFFQELNITSRVFADFSDTSLEAVELTINYKGREADGTRNEKVVTLTFEDSTPQTWTPALIGDSREVSYRWRAKMQGQGFGPFSPSVTTDSNAINLAIPEPGIVSRDIIAGDLDWESLGLSSVNVTLRYEDSANGVSPVEDTIVLTQATPAGQFLAEIGAHVSRPVQYKLRFSFASGEVISDSDWNESTSQALIVNKPFTRTMEVRLLPVGEGWSDVVQVVVELFYDDGQGNITDDVVTLKTAQDLRVWSVWLQEGAPTNFTYQVTASYTDGEFTEGALISDSGSGVVQIEVREPSETKVRIIPARLNFEDAPLTKVVLRHPESGEMQTLTFDSNTQETWRIPVRPNDDLFYTAEITHFPASGDPVVLDIVEKSDTALVIPPFVVPESGVIEYQIMSTLVDFIKTPLVTIDLVYEDEANGVLEQHSFAFDGSISTFFWNLDVPDKTRKLFSWTLTYFKASDGAAHVVGPSFDNRTLFIIPPFSDDED